MALLHEREPALQVDGEMQADTAVVERILTKTYPFAKLRSAANVLIFPSLDAANIAYKLLDRLGDLFSDNPNGEQAVQKLASRHIGEAAKDSELKTRAESNTTAMLQGLLRSLGFDEVRVAYKG